MSKEKTYKRFIKCSQRITYYQEVELTASELALLENVDDMNICQWSEDENQRKAYDLIESLIDPQTVFEDDQEYQDFELNKTEK